MEHHDYDTAQTALAAPLASVYTVPLGSSAAPASPSPACSTQHCVAAWRHTNSSFVRPYLGKGATSLLQVRRSRGGISQPLLSLDHLGERLLEHLFTDPMAFQALHQCRHWVLL